MVVFPNAKINIGLNVFDKRTDGFHNISSFFYPIPYFDVLEVIESNNMEFSYEGLPIPEGKNLVQKAYQLLDNEYDLPIVTCVLLKSIPIGGGLGGGSSDGAFMLTLLNDLFKLGLTIDELKSYAEKLGSDCPFFVDNKPAMISGRGEVIKPIEYSLSGLNIVVATPDIHINTGEAYSGIDPTNPEKSIESYLNEDIESWQGSISNDFETYVFQQYPQIELIRDQLLQEGALYTSLTGSGASVYGIFRNEIDIHFPENIKIWKGSL